MFLFAILSPFFRLWSGFCAQHFALSFRKLHQVSHPCKQYDCGSDAAGLVLGFSERTQHNPLLFPYRPAKAGSVGTASVLKATKDSH
jgi:hypothetical protein